MTAPDARLTVIQRPLSGNCWKVRLCLAEVQRPYRTVAPEDLPEAAFSRFSRRRRIPVLLEEGRPPLEESAAILLRLARGTDLLPERFGDVVLSWLIWDQAELSKPLALPRHYARTGQSGARAEEIARLRQEAHAGLAFLDGWLSARDWLAGDGFTVADLGLHCYVALAGEGGTDIAPYPAVRAWLDRIRARPRWQPLTA
ncbi:glutathione S-transferase family protein [Celeribacter indicus]|uniref:Glutathione S-transferase domain protein n=1 Tax=Celeribacter indicus TaxID=1208324 RepID=A0A0B5E327_9RHOB|nr:glutathione S-transferase family protein [Celeribacter indicus]AJE46847.1 Glutathione S-transferase domain protein [Celeribacter indicus]SDW80412.1 glutathione S-transferase [Celeribacter indicus]